MGDGHPASYLLEGMLNDGSAEPIHLPLSLLEKITDNFSPDKEIGRGGFGVVYKGVLTNRMEVAVKKILNYNAIINDKSFEGEVICLMKAKHTNIVRLLGYCAVTQSKFQKYKGRLVTVDILERLICFEYIRNGSLDKHIEDESLGLQWQQRYRIINGIIQGLRHLHEEEKIIHLDLKPQNILLDENMVPKITDFGLSRLFGSEYTQVITKKTVCGTRPYIAPEYLDSGKATFKADIYSLGVIVLEIVTGTRSEPVTEKVLEKWRNKLDESQGDTINMLEQIRVCVEIGIQCTKTEAMERPFIQDIINTLGERETMDMSVRTAGAGSSSARQMSREQDSKFHSAKEMPAYLQLGKGNTPFENILIPMKGHIKIFSVEVLSARSWILITHFEGPFRIWNYQKEKEIVMPHEVMREQGLKFLTAKFIEREQWIVAGGCDHCIYVFNYNTMQMVKSFKALTNQITSLAIHSKKPYVLATSYDYKIGLWDWKRDWESVEKFEEKHKGSVYQIAFNPRDDNGFASVSEDGTIKIWSVDSRSPSMTFTWNSSEKMEVRCLAYFTNSKKQFLITGSDDGTAKIWDVQKTDSVETLSRHESKSSVSTVCSHPELPLLMTGSWDGTVCLWNSNSFRLERTLKVGLGKVHALGCIEGTRRIVIGNSDGLAIVEI